MDASKWEAVLCDGGVWMVVERDGDTSRRIAVFEPSHYVSAAECEENAKRVALMHNAEGVMQRRGWTVIAAWSDHGEFIVHGWHVIPPRGQWDHHVEYPDPFTALVEADAWMTAQEGK